MYKTYKKNYFPRFLNIFFFIQLRFLLKNTKLHEMKSLNVSNPSIPPERLIVIDAVVEVVVARCSVTLIPIILLYFRSLTFTVRCPALSNNYVTNLVFMENNYWIFLRFSNTCFFMDFASFFLGYAILVTVNYNQNFSEWRSNCMIFI